MIVVRLELWPKGDKSRAVDLGTAEIVNDRTGSSLLGNYKVRLLKAAAFSARPGTLWKHGRVVAFPRASKTCGPWELLYLALRGIVRERAERAERTGKGLVTYEVDPAPQPAPGVAVERPTP